MQQQGPRQKTPARQEREVIELHREQFAVERLFDLIAKIAGQVQRNPVPAAKAFMNALNEACEKRGLSRLELIITKIRLEYDFKDIEIKIALADVLGKKRINLSFENDGLYYRDDFIASMVPWETILENPKRIEFLIDAPIRAGPLKAFKELSEKGDVDILGK